MRIPCVHQAQKIWKRFFSGFDIQVLKGRGRFKGDGLSSPHGTLISVPGGRDSHFTGIVEVIVEMSKDPFLHDRKRLGRSCLRHQIPALQAPDHSTDHHRGSVFHRKSSRSISPGQERPSDRCSCHWSRSGLSTRGHTGSREGREPSSFLPEDGLPLRIDCTSPK